LGPNILLSTLFSKTLSLHSSLNVISVSSSCLKLFPLHMFRSVFSSTTCF
jgi:hypothetical protein